MLPRRKFQPAAWDGDASVMRPLLEELLLHPWREAEGRWVKTAMVLCAPSGTYLGVPVTTEAGGTLRFDLWLPEVTSAVVLAEQGVLSGKEVEERAEEFLAALGNSRRARSHLVMLTASTPEELDALGSQTGPEASRTVLVADVRRGPAPARDPRGIPPGSMEGDYVPGASAGPIIALFADDRATRFEFEDLCVRLGVPVPAWSVTGLCAEADSDGRCRGVGGLRAFLLADDAAQPPSRFRPNW